jgi:hypothetical protein
MMAMGAYEDLSGAAVDDPPPRSMPGSRATIASLEIDRSAARDIQASLYALRHHAHAQQSR